MVEDARFWWISGVAWFCVLSAIVIHNIDWAPKCEPGAVIVGCSPEGLTAGQLDNVEYGCWTCDPPDVQVRGGRDRHLPDRLDGSQ